MVALGYFARAAARTLLAVLPVSRCSSERMLLVGSSDCAVLATVDVTVLVAALADRLPAAMPPIASPDSSSAGSDALLHGGGVHGVSPCSAPWPGRMRRLPGWT